MAEKIWSDDAWDSYVKLYIAQCKGHYDDK